MAHALISIPSSGFVVITSAFELLRNNGIVRVSLPILALTAVNSPVKFQIAERPLCRALRCSTTANLLRCCPYLVSPATSD